MATSADHIERQRAYDERYAQREQEHRPKPEMELPALLNLAREAQADPARLIEWQLAATPENVLVAIEAEKWDRANPHYSCIMCRDGEELPKGYVCQACGADNPSWT